MTPILNLPKLKKKMLTVMSNFPSIRAPFYVPKEVFPEGTAVKLDPATPNGILMSQTGNGAVTIGLALQETYDDTVLGQLQGYNFANDTRQRLDGSPIGVLTGQGYAEIRNYVGQFAWNSPVYVGPSGMLVTTGHAWAVSNNLLPVIAETAGQDGSIAVRIRFNFKLV
jgi:hypothetical protein